MSWGIDFKADIYLSKQDYQANKYQVQDAIDECILSISEWQKELAMYASANIQEVCDPEWITEPIAWLKGKINDLSNNMLEEQTKLVNLQYYLEHLKEQERKEGV
jgi:hypothetical protein